MSLLSNFSRQVFSVLLIVILTGCPKETPAPSNQTPKVVQEAYDIMKLPYFWSEQVNQNLDLKGYGNPVNLVKDLKVAQDRFTFIQEGDAVAKQLQGTPISTGLNLKYLKDTLYISYVDLNSPANLAGLKRAYPVLSINGNTFTPKPNPIPAVNFNSALTLKYLDGNGKPQTKTITPSQYQAKVVVHQEVKTLKNKQKVGYLVYTAFTSNSDQELNAAFANFKQQGIKDLILDLRYNGGGSIDVARHLASLIKNTLKDRVFTQYNYNQPFTEYLKKNSPSRVGQKLTFNTPDEGLNLARLFVLTGNGTASASEMIINGLKPFIEVLLIGAKTFGKNVGSYVYTLEGNGKTYTFLPIIIKVSNANNESDYANGFEPNFSSLDDVSEPFGSLDDPMLNQAIHYIENGTFKPVSILQRRLQTEQISLGANTLNNLIILKQ